MSNDVNKERVRLWVDALRSGEFEQGRGKLQRNGKFCCLGVGCEVAMRNGHPIDRHTLPFDDETRVAYDGSTNYWPGHVYDWFGITPGFELEGNSPEHWNDTAGATFAEIADKIERQYLTEE